MSKVFFAKSLDELQLVASQLLRYAFPSKKFILSGEMGVGKTSLIKALSLHLGFLDLVSSPTFSLVNEYYVNDKTIIYHFDFYRIKDVEEAFDMGIEEYFESGNVCLIEWPEMIEEILPEKYLEVNISLKGEGREYILTTNDHG